MILEGGKILVQQIIILFLMIGVGFLAAYFGLLHEEGTRQITDLLLMIITPCVIIMAFQLSFDRSLLKNILIAALLAGLTHTIGILIATIFFGKNPTDRNVIFTFSSIFYNGGFFSLPLLRALLGNIGALYGSIFVAVFNIFCWTYGIHLMTGKRNSFNWKIFLNPGVVAVVTSILLVLFNIQLPGVIQITLTNLATLHSPLAMIIIGSQFFTYKNNFTFKDLALWKTVLARNLIIPLIMLFINFYLAGDKTLFFASVITAAAPTASNTVLFATKFGKDVNTSIQTVMLTTLMTLITIPLIMGLAMLLKGSF